ncbi:MAG: type II secretion system protein GspG [Chloracidobacterium sp.]|nr:type II secretion system protein GspG [Chloracidobacterium sp.]
MSCLAQVPGARVEPKDRLTDLMREIPSSRRPDKTMVFVPEYREARLKRERRNRRTFFGVMISLVLVAAAGIVFWRINAHKQARAQAQRRETMARRELDLYAKALEIFYEDFGRYPTLEEGLAALSRQPSTLSGWRGPYIDGDFSVDPWGTEYVYQVVNGGTGYILSTYGPEGEANGRAFLLVHSGTSGTSLTPTTVPK